MSHDHTHDYVELTGKCAVCQELDPQYTEIREGWVQRFMCGSGFIDALDPVSDLAEVTDVPPIFLRNSIAIRVTRDMLLGAGRVTPTPEEQAEMDEARRLNIIRHNRHVFMCEAAWAFLSMIKNPIVRAVLDLHAMVDAAHEYAEPTCAHCVYDSEMGYQEDWPCETTRVIAIAYGIEMPR